MTGRGLTALRHGPFRPRREPRFEKPGPPIPSGETTEARTLVIRDSFIRVDHGDGHVVGVVQRLEAGHEFLNFVGRGQAYGQGGSEGGRDSQVGCVEIFADYPRAHVAQYSALYTSLSTRYDIDLDNPSAQSLPLGNRSKRWKEKTNVPVVFRRTINNRLEGLQRNLDIPLPASTQWDVVHAFAPSVMPAYEELLRQAAQGEVLHNDDTTVKILELMGKRREQQSDLTESSRTGLFTSGVVAVREGRKVALFFSGRQHAGENLADVLKHRAECTTSGRNQYDYAATHQRYFDIFTKTPPAKRTDDF